MVNIKTKLNKNRKKGFFSGTSFSVLFVIPAVFLLLSAGYRVSAAVSPDAEIPISDTAHAVSTDTIPDVSITGAAQSGTGEVTVTWTPVTGVDGYLIRTVRTMPATETRQSYNYACTIKEVEGAAESSAVIRLPEGKSYPLYVVGYQKTTNGKREGSTTIDLTFPGLKKGAAILAVAKSGSKGAKITWEATGGDEYILYRAEQESGPYRRICSTTKTSRIDTITVGTTYHYKVATRYGEYWSTPSESVSIFLPKSGGKEKTVQYDWNTKHRIGTDSAHVDNSRYYVAGGKLYMAHYVKETGDGRYLYVYQLDKNYKIKSTQKVNLPKNCIWGGFIQGNDGYFYLVVGFLNEKDSRTKTAIQIIRYDKNWKKKKTVSVKGLPAGDTDGIYEAFVASNVSMDMKDSLLYIATGRTIFADGSGTHHQTALNLKLDTSEMKTVAAGDVKSSHSFGQAARFKGESLYIANLTDGWFETGTSAAGNILYGKRGLAHALIDDYGTDVVGYAGYKTFEARDYKGTNYQETGIWINGMEVGRENILTFINAQPHDYGVKGVTGFDASGDWKSKYKQNACLVITNRTTGETTRKWITTYNPKRNKNFVSPGRIVKIDDNHFALFYAVTPKYMDSSNNNGVLHYVVVDGNGKILKHKTYKNIVFHDASCPVLYNGSFVWGEEVFSKLPSGISYYLLTTYSIPATW